MVWGGGGWGGEGVAAGKGGCDYISLEMMVP
jgi:hypothetical protein